MKKWLPYLVMFLVSTLAAGGIVFAVLKLRPGLAGAEIPASDSIAVQAPPSGKMYGPAPEELAGGDPGTPDPAVNASGDPVQTLKLALEDERKKSADLADQLRGVMDSTQKTPAAADSGGTSDRRSMAKVLEVMDPSSAARILKDYPDGEVKTIILTLKKRQAAKILAALDPDRAARIMR